MIVMNSTNGDLFISIYNGSMGKKWLLRERIPGPPRIEWRVLRVLKEEEVLDIVSNDVVTLGNDTDTLHAFDELLAKNLI